MQSRLSYSFLIDGLQNTSHHSNQLLQQLGIESIDALDQALPAAAAARRQNNAGQHYYLVQNSVSENSLSYLFAPFINAVLNLKTVYIASKQGVIEQVYPHYFQLDALALQKQQSMNDMQVSFDLLANDFEAADIQLYGLCKALLDEHCHQLYIFSEQAIEATFIAEIQALAHIEVVVIPLLQAKQDINEINFKQLFWKTKTAESSQLCRSIASTNAPLLSQLLKVKLSRAEHLIDDLLYSEHIFEKLSVFGEFTETILKHHRLSAARVIS